MRSATGRRERPAYSPANPSTNLGAGGLTAGACAGPGTARRLPRARGHGGGSGRVERRLRARLQRTWSVSTASSGGAGLPGQGGGGRSGAKASGGGGSGGAGGCGGTGGGGGASGGASFALLAIGRAGSRSITRLSKRHAGGWGRERRHGRLGSESWRTRRWRRYRSNGRVLRRKRWVWRRRWRRCWRHGRALRGRRLRRPSPDGGHKARRSTRSQRRQAGAARVAQARAPAREGRQAPPAMLGHARESSRCRRSCASMKRT